MACAIVALAFTVGFLRERITGAKRTSDFWNNSYKTVETQNIGLRADIKMMDDKITADSDRYEDSLRDLETDVLAATKKSKEELKGVESAYKNKRDELEQIVFSKLSLMECDKKGYKIYSLQESENFGTALGITDDRTNQLLQAVKESQKSDKSISEKLEDLSDICTRANEVAYVSLHLGKQLNKNPIDALMKRITGRDLGGKNED